MRLSLLSLVLAACLPTGGSTTQEATTEVESLFLSVAQNQIYKLEKVNKAYEFSEHAHAKITKMEFGGPNDSYDQPVKLVAGKQLTDAGKLMFKNIEFEFTYEKKHYTCISPSKEKNPTETPSNLVALLHKIPFDLTNSCSARNTAPAPLTGTYNGRVQLRAHKVEQVNYEGGQLNKDHYVHHYHYTYTGADDCKLDVWIDADNNTTDTRAAKYLDEYKHFLRKTDKELIIRGESKHGSNIVIACGKNGFEYLDSETRKVLFSPQMYGTREYSPTGNSHLYLSSKDGKTLTIVAALRFTIGLKVTATITPSSRGPVIMGREARIYTAGENGAINEDLYNGKRTVVVTRSTR